MSETPKRADQLTFQEWASKSSARDEEIRRAVDRVLARNRTGGPMPSDVLHERTAEEVNNPPRESADAFARRLVRLVQEIPRNKIAPPRTKKPARNPPAFVGLAVLEAEGHSVAPLLLSDLCAEVAELRTSPTPEAIDRAVELGKEIGGWERVRNTGPEILEQAAEARSAEATEREHEADRTHRAPGAKGGRQRVANQEARREEEQRQATATTRVRQDPKFRAVVDYRKKNPEATLPELARHLFDGRNATSEGAATKWLRRNKGLFDPPILPGSPGRRQVKRA